MIISETALEFPDLNSPGNSTGLPSIWAVMGLTVDDHLLAWDWDQTLGRNPGPGLQQQSRHIKFGHVGNHVYFKDPSV